MTKTFNTAESFRSYAKQMGIKESVWEGFQITTKQGPMMRTITENGLTMTMRIEAHGTGYKMTTEFSG
jgi:hypothetical protein